ncbi:MAG TPA: aldehyde dehydrogenase family protein [Nocardioidaceae bacterium]|nr:aldehyde dehydrogenase family protein [Nocardioidaceae bacterium]
MTVDARPNELVVTDPATGKVVGSVPDTSADEVYRIAAELRMQQIAWDALGPKGRRPWLTKYADWMLANSDRIIDVLVSETGKVRPDAMLEVKATAEIIRYWADNAEKFLADEREKAPNAMTLPKKLTKVYQPYPLVGVITPWNFPVTLFLMDAIPALAAGCAVIEKPSEETPLAAQLLVDGWRSIGAPGVLECITGGGATGAAVVDAADYVQFTGSTATGKKIAAAAAGQLKPYSLELGGKDPAVVLADADIDRAVNGIAWGGLFNSGQVCISVERVYVEAPIYDEFVTKLTDKVKSLSQGVKEGSDVGAMVTSAQVDIVERHVKEAVEAGARVTTGGKRGTTGNFFEPTVLVDVDHSMSCIKEETFGPTIPVMKVADADEAIRMANDSIYGLSASVWTKDVARGEQVARRIEAGAVNVNDVFSNLFAPPLPHNGWKDSGVGARAGGAYGIRKYCKVQAQTSPRIPVMKNELTWFPYTKRRSGIVSRFLDLVVGRGLRQRLGRAK